MWKAFAYTLLAEVCLFGVGMLTVPVWLSENVSIWLPIAFALLLIMMCWDSWPRIIQVNQDFRWVSMEGGGRYYRDLLVEFDMTEGVMMFDSMSSPHPNQLTTSPVASAFHWIALLAINEGLMEVWGVPENGSKSERLLKADDDATAYSKSIDEGSLFIMANGVYYRDLQIKRSTIKSYVEHVRSHDAELKRRAKKQD